MGLFSKKKTDKQMDEQTKKSADLEVDNKKSADSSDSSEISKKQKTKSTAKETKKNHGQSYEHLIRPIITEKASFLGMYNQYIFEVAPHSNKIEIKKALQSLYGVKPAKINSLNMRGKSIRYGRHWGQMKNWKKIIVTLKAGDKIDVYESI